MFGSNENSGIKGMYSLLKQIQKEFESDESGREMRSYQHAFVQKTKTFIEYGQSYAQEGYSAAGGLAMYCNNVLVQTIGPINKGTVPAPIIVDLAEKMAFTAIGLSNEAQYNSLSEKDLSIIASASSQALVWLEHPLRKDLVRKIEDKLSVIGEELESAGVRNSLQNAEKFIGSLTSW